MNPKNPDYRIIRRLRRFVVILRQSPLTGMTPGMSAIACCALMGFGLLFSVSALGQTVLDEASLAGELSRALEDKSMPGLRAAVRYPDGTLVLAAVGYADPETGQALDNTIGMPGGSTGKTFAATLALLLVEDEALSLDDPASRWLGETEWFSELPNADTMKVRHLLTHSSGMEDYISSIRFHTRMVMRVMRHGSAYFTPEELIGYTLDKKPLNPAGAGYFYSDAGYLVLGRIIEAAGGADYYDLLQERILTPQKLDRVRPAVDSAMTDVAMGHMGGSPSLKADGRMKFDPRSEWTGGGLITTPEMLVQFYSALAEGRIVDPETVETMIQGGWQNPDQPAWHYGMGMFVQKQPAAIGHGGLWPGYRSHVKHYLESGITIAVQTNRDGDMELPRLVDRIAEQTGQVTR